MLRFWLRALTKPALDLTLTTHPGLVTRIREKGSPRPSSGASLHLAR
ncbi:hypothetical protein [Bosea sp. BE125]|nr:hypothetical protein [Bosea sp. BE125]